MEKVIILDHVLAKGLKNVSLTIQYGEIVGILNVNNLNGDPLLKIVSGLEKSSSGFVSVLGFDPYSRHKDFLKQISFIRNETKDQLDISRDIYELSNKDFNKNFFEISKYIKRRSIIAHLIHLPKILFLDNVNFDLDFIYDFNKNTKGTVLVSTYKLDILVKLVRRIVLLDSDQIIFDGPIDELLEKYAKEMYISAKLSTKVDIDNINIDYKVVSYDYPNILISSPRTVVSLTAAEFMQNFPVESISIQEMPIEKIINNI